VKESGVEKILVSVFTAAILATLATPLHAATTPAPAAKSQQEQGDEHVRRLVKQLGDKDYFVRQQAETELTKLGFEAFDAVSEATTDEDLEIASRARYLLRMMRVQWADKNDPKQVQQLLQDYESQDADGRQARMRGLATLPDHAGVAALCRLVRYEKSSQLSKQAALELLANVSAEQAPDKATVEAIRKVLGNCRRGPAAWLLTYARFAEDPSAAAGPWNKLVDAEIALLHGAGNQTTQETVAALLRFQVARLRKIGRNDDAIIAIRRLIQLDSGDPETLPALVEWLVDQKAWQAVNEVADRFKTQIAANPLLLYSIAEAKLEQGKKDSAEKLAQEALKLNPDKETETLAGHLMTATNLRTRGLYPWAVREFRYVIASSPAGDETAQSAALMLSELLHDQGDDLAAAQTLLDSTNTGVLGAFRPANTEVGGRTLGETRARTNFFFACHWESKGDLAKQRQFLDKALADDQSDVDVLIACYRLREQKREFHKKILHLIAAAADATRAKIKEEPTDPTNYNQLAWLIGNTEGDMDEALNCSQKSLELSPGNGGYYDTLGRVYFARGEYEYAVKFQTKADELEPHSGLIKKQLELFRKKLEEKKGAAKAKKA
jgi:tetratricopeptide (TPR) repeat protein